MGFNYIAWVIQEEVSMHQGNYGQSHVASIKLDKGQSVKDERDEVQIPEFYMPAMPPIWLTEKLDHLYRVWLRRRLGR